MSTNHTMQVHLTDRHSHRPGHTSRKRGRSDHWYRRTGWAGRSELKHKETELLYTVQKTEKRKCLE